VAADISSFYLSWWYTPTTKLGIYFTGYDVTPTNPLELTALGNSGINYSNGMSASVEEALILRNKITENPVQNGVSVTDAIIKLPKMLNLTGYLTSMTPSLILGHLSFSQLGSATQLLIDAYEAKVGLTITTGLLFGKSYLKLDNMAIEELVIPRNNAIGKTAIRFQLSLKQINIVTTTGLSSASFSNAQPYSGGIPT
jgi:hypothetical protein